MTLKHVYFQWNTFEYDIIFRIHILKNLTYNIGWHSEKWWFDLKLGSQSFVMKGEQKPLEKNTEVHSLFPLQAQGNLFDRNDNKMSF